MLASLLSSIFVATKMIGLPQKYLFISGFHLSRIFLNEDGETSEDTAMTTSAVGYDNRRVCGRSLLPEVSHTRRFNS